MRPSPTRFAVLTGAALVGLLQGGCNSDLGDSSTSTTTQSATGVWSGSDSVSGAGVTALINSGGQAEFIRSDGVLFSGSAQVSGSNLVVAVDGYPDFPSAFSDGSGYGVGTLNGTVMSAASLDASLTFTTDNNGSITGTWSLNYAALSDNSSSTATISGNYTDAVTGATVSISSTGVMTGADSSNGCQLNGSVSTADSTHNLYEVSYTYSDCTGSYQPLIGVQFTGLAYLNSNLSPAQVTMAATGASATNHYGIVSTLNGS
jgi:hypothetical protein